MSPPPVCSKHGYVPIICLPLQYAVNMGNVPILCLPLQYAVNMGNVPILCLPLQYAVNMGMYQSYVSPSSMQ